MVLKRQVLIADRSIKINDMMTKHKTKKRLEGIIEKLSERGTHYIGSLSLCRYCVTQFFKSRNI